jgi:CO/xanthine dehydrogenase FAD-binding subunit
VLADVSRFIGQRADAQLAQHIAHAAAQACSPMSDIKASADYRRALVQTLGAQVIQQAFQSVGGR